MLQGHKSIIELLLEKGADENTQGEPFGIAPQAASLNDCDAIIWLLLERGVDVKCMP